jgi:folate-binding protein YgfZ
MDRMQLHSFHERLGARFTSLGDAEIVADYGEASAEYTALKTGVGLLDLGFRGRLCLTGEDRIRFLHGQVTNDVQGLKPGQGCYAALTNAKARMLADLNIWRLQDELLLDFEPGLVPVVTQRLEKYIIADDVQIVEVAPHFGMLSVQGPQAAQAVANSGLAETIPGASWTFSKTTHAEFGELYWMNRPRCGQAGFDLFAPAGTLEKVAERLLASVGEAHGRICGWTALEMARIEAGIPRFGADIDETNIPLEAGLENVGISFKKGCYIGQEIISRIRTYSEVARALRRLVLADDAQLLPAKGDKLFYAGKEVGYITSAAASPMLKRKIALGYVRKEVNEPGTELSVGAGEGGLAAKVVGVPFEPFEVLQMSAR